MTRTEAHRRLKLSIDQQKSGQIPNAFGPACTITVHGYLTMNDGTEWVHVSTPTGVYGIDEDGIPHEARPVRLN